MGPYLLAMDSLSFLKFRMVACAGHGSFRHGDILNCVLII